MKRWNFFMGIMFLMGVLIVLGYFICPKAESGTEAKNLSQDLATLSSLSPSAHIKTVAICNSSNFCQDYKVICSDNQEIDKEPIPGAFIQHPYDWVDDRNIDYDNLCG